MKAVAVLSSSVGVSGTVFFTQEIDRPTTVTGNVLGLKPGRHGFHVHTFGDTTHGCMSIGPYFNPLGKEHGAPEDDIRHAGDLGNIVVGDDGTVSVFIVDRQIPLLGPNSIVGRAVAIRADLDDLGKGGHELSKTTGNSGEIVAYGVIGFQGILLEDKLVYAKPFWGMSNGHTIIRAPIRQTHGGCIYAAAAKHLEYQTRIAYSKLCPDYPQVVAIMDNEIMVNHILLEKMFKKISPSGSVSALLQYGATSQNIPLWNAHTIQLQHIYKEHVFGWVSDIILYSRYDRGEVIRRLIDLLRDGTLLGTMAIAKNLYPEYGSHVYMGATLLVSPDTHTVVILGVMDLSVEDASRYNSSLSAEDAAKYSCGPGEYFVYQESRGLVHANSSLLKRGLTLGHPRTILGHPRTLLKVYQVPYDQFLPTPLRRPLQTYDRCFS